MRPSDTLRTQATSLVSRSDPNCTIVTAEMLLLCWAPFLVASTPLIYILFNTAGASDLIDRDFSSEHDLSRSI
jgi:hypothetical protein